MTDNPPIRKHVNKIEKILTFESKVIINCGYCLEVLTPETIELPGSTKNEITLDENGRNLPYLEVAEIILVHIVYI